VPTPVPLVRVVRSGLEESVHVGSVAVCDADGRLVASAGDPDRLVFARSSMKPLQAAVSLSSIADALPAELAAIACASHNAEPEHVAAVRRLLRGGRLSPVALRCPPDVPSRHVDARVVARPRPIFHNCSGKHAAMLRASAVAGWPLETYRNRGHPLQRAVLRAVVAATDVEEPAIGVDGCGVPVFGVPLRAMATLFARLAAPARLGRLSAWVELATRAMLEHPFLVAGTGRTDTVLMGAASGVVSKGGAEGLSCAAVLEGGLGVAVKIADGGERAAGPALIHALWRLGAIDDQGLERLGDVARRPVLGGGRRVGELVASFTLRRRGA
jgi:L-asparaginase II